MGPDDHSNNLLFDDNARKRSHQKAELHFRQHDFLFRHVCDDIVERLSMIRGDIKNVLCLGTRVPASFESTLKNRAGVKRMTISALDKAPFTKIFDCIISPLSLHNVNHLPVVLKHIRHSLKPNGVFLAALPGEKTLHELRASLIETETALKNGTSPRVLPFIDKEQIGHQLLQAGFTLPVIDRDLLTVTYRDIYALMHDLRYMGESNILTGRNKIYPGKSFFEHAQTVYHERFAYPDGRLPATFDLMYLIGWTKEDNP